MFPDEGFNLEGIPTKSIIDLEIKNDIPYSTLKMWQHSVQFEMLTQNQKTCLEHFISNYTVKTYQENQLIYFVKNEKDKNIGINILELYFGNLWQFTLDRLDHHIDGYLLTIHHQGHKYRIYRALEIRNHYYPELHLISASSY